MNDSQLQSIKSSDILIVDDDRASLKLLSELLGAEGYRVRPVDSPQLAIESALAQPPTLILLDVKMPGMDGFEVCRRLKQDERTRGVPIMFLTALKSTRDKAHAFQAGGVDFIPKPYEEAEVLARVRTHVNLYNMQLMMERQVRERTSDALEREERFRATFEQAAVGIAHVSTEGRFLRINQKFCDIVGFSPEEMMSKSFQEITHPDDVDADLEYVQQLLDGERTNYSMDKRYYRKDGAIVWVNLTVSLLRDEERNPKYFVSVVSDISERKQAEEALRQNHDFLEHLTSSVPDAILSIKLPERTINWVNDSFNVLGYEPEEYVGESTKKYYVNPEDYYTVGDLQQDAIQKGKKFIRTEVMARRKDGRAIPVELTATFYREKGELAQITALVRDISDRKQAEEELRQSHDFLQHLTSSVPDAVFSVKMPERTIEWANDSFHVLGYEPVECVGEFTEKFYASPEECEAFGALLAEAIQKGRDVVRAEALLRRKSGEVFAAEINASVYREDGEVASVTSLVRDISERKLAEKKMREAYTEIEQLQKQLQAESAYLQEEIKLEHDFENIIGNSNALQYALFKVMQVAETDSSVLVLGETGTGKELIARAIHHNSQRKDRPLIKINCATLPAHLIESELFGHEKGSFTGAVAKHKGRFEVADGSSLFLDEIGELPIELQAKLLRVIEDGEFERLGSTKTMKVDVRIIAATNRNLEKDVKEGRFRQDLWYRLNVFPITLPPLRDRIEDIPLIVQYYVHTFARKLGKDIVSVPEKVMKTLQNYTWPGNVRELQNVLERAVIGTPGSKLQLSEALSEDNKEQREKLKSLHDMERDYIISILEKTSWKVSGKNSASEILGLDRSTLRARMKKLGIHKDSSPDDS